MKHFERINQLLDKFCFRCQQVGLNNTCYSCNLAHRKHHLSDLYRNIPKTKIIRLNAFTELSYEV